jgi:hypothetical protein
VAKVFISYRRADSASASGRIYDRLVARFGQQNVFKDVDNIPPGVNFGAYIQNSLRQCAVVLVVIGPHWLDPGGPRLDDPTDWVRIEIEMAFALKLTVIPLLVEGAPVPNAAQLPGSLRELTQINMVMVRNDPDFAHDMERLMAALVRPLAIGAPAPAFPSMRGPVAQMPVAQMPVAQMPGGATRLSPFAFWSLAFGLPVAVVAGLDAVLNLHVNVDLYYNHMALFTTAFLVIALAGFALIGFLAVRRTGSIGSSVLSAIVAAIVIGIVAGVARAWSFANDQVSTGNGVPWGDVFYGQIIEYILTYGIITFILSIPASAMGGAIGRRAKPVSP